MNLFRHMQIVQVFFVSSMQSPPECIHAIKVAIVHAINLPNVQTQCFVICEPETETALAVVRFVIVADEPDDDEPDVNTKR